MKRHRKIFKLYIITAEHEIKTGHFTLKNAKEQARNFRKFYDPVFILKVPQTWKIGKDGKIKKFDYYSSSRLFLKC